MKSSELRSRVRRFLDADRRVADLDRIFLALRDRCYGRASIREIGDFVAHRERREKGPVTHAVRDILLSFQSWLAQGDGIVPDLAMAKRISAANLRTATDEQLAERLGLHRPVVKSVLAQAVIKMEKDRFEEMTGPERKVFDYLATAFVWNPAFTDERVAEDLAFVLAKSGALLKSERPDYDAGRFFLTLYVTALMHDSAVVMEDGARFDLVAGFDNEQRRVEVRALMDIPGWGKKVTAPVCVFWTGLAGSEHCDSDLAAAPGDWRGAIEVGTSGRLSRLSPV